MQWFGNKISSVSLGTRTRVSCWKFSVLSLSQEGNEVSASQNVTKLPTARLCFFESVIARVLPQKVDSDSFCLFCDVSVCDVLGQARD